ncbi:hypothetical protein P280DRAFT_474436 [Massarina eburnea CBS 473.64]|uniref:F-box domain-containing protein n=1 Tax=Massarina eburnea CBS 473.64 TaxID=1395130 RepID=A0A6A6RKX4_9PLEO|nr:hypothetical protein P280DRAFT_474436 [Massarina eburnea CBS 473.64]
MLCAIPSKRKAPIEASPATSKTARIATSETCNCPNRGDALGSEVDTKADPKTLSSLSEELLDDIVCRAGRPSDCDGYPDWPTLASITLVSQQMHRIAMPHLYAHIKTDLRTTAEPSECSRSILYALLAKRANLAGRVNALTINKAKSNSERSDTETDNIRGLVSALPNLSFLDTASLTFAELLLMKEEHMLDNITRLDLCLHTASLFQPSITHVYSLPNIITLNFRYGSVTMPVPTPDLDERVFHRPSTSLKHLSYTGVSNIPISVSLGCMSYLGANCTSLESLALRNFAGRHGALTMQLIITFFEPAISHSLKKLEVWDEGLHDRRLMSALTTQKATQMYGAASYLEEVDIDIPLLERYTSRDEGWDIDLCLVTAKSLRSLRLRGKLDHHSTHNSLTWALPGLSRHVKAKQPNLKRVVLELDGEVPESLDGSLRNIGKSFEANGVKFEVVSKEL